MKQRLDTKFDTIIIGAGPAGCSAAAVLADHGLAVLVLEREKFRATTSANRSSLHLPSARTDRHAREDAPVRIRQEVQRAVCLASGRASQPFYFATRYEAKVAQTWQVLRSEFDLMLMENARGKGAHIVEQTTVTELLRENGATVGVRARLADGSEREFRAPMTLDCSGKDALAPTRLNWRIREPKLNKVAVWTYYRGAKRDAGEDGGATTVAYVPEKAVLVHPAAPGHHQRRRGGRGQSCPAGRQGSEGDLPPRVGENAWIRDHLAAGTPTGEYRVLNEYSWRSRYCAEDGLLLAVIPLASSIRCSPRA